MSLAAPCKNCSSRYPNCHAECTGYKSWRTALDEDRKIIADAKSKEMELKIRRLDAIKRMQVSKKHK